MLARACKEGTALPAVSNWESIIRVDVFGWRSASALRWCAKKIGYLAAEAS
jgi:hypothetical protein